MSTSTDPDRRLQVVAIESESGRSLGGVAPGDGPPDIGESIGRARRRRLWVGGLAVLVGTAVGGLLIGSRMQSPEQAASNAAPPAPSWITATVDRRVLSQTVITRGDVRPQVTVAVAVPASVEGSAIVTSVLVAVGDEVVEGARLVEVSGRPVFVLAGDVPVYRSLRPGMTGADVAQLQDALARLGYAPDGDGVFGEATKLAVSALYEAAGYAPVPTSDSVAVDRAAAEQVLADAGVALEDAEVNLAQLTDGGVSAAVVSTRAELDAARRGVNDTVAAADTAIVLAQQQYDMAAAENHRVVNDPETAPGERDQARLAVSQAAGALEQARRDKASQVAGANDRVRIAEANVAEAETSSDVDAVTRARDQAVAARDRALVALSTLNATSGPTVAQGEIVFAPSLPARVQQAVASLGPLGSGDSSASANADEVVTLAGGELVVSMSLRPGEVGLVRVGMNVDLLDEQSNTAYPATVLEVADAGRIGADGQLGVPVVIAPDEPLPDTLSGANLRVTITSASTEAATLVVPLAAVSSAADGSTYVAVLAAGADDAAEPVSVAVATGLSADGFVAVEPVTTGALSDGDRVVVGR